MSVVGRGVPGVCEHGDRSAPPRDAGFPALSRPRPLASGVGPAEGVSTPSWPSWASACGSLAGPGWGAPVSDVGSPRGGRPPPRCTLLPVLPVPEAALSGPGNAKGAASPEEVRAPWPQARRSSGPDPLPAEPPLGLPDPRLGLGEGGPEDPGAVPGKAGRRRLCSAGVCVALPGPGEEGDRPPGGEGAEGAEQEDPGGQPPGAAEGGAAPGGLRGPEAGPPWPKGRTDRWVDAEAPGRAGSGRAWIQGCGPRLRQAVSLHLSEGPETSGPGSQTPPSAGGVGGGQRGLGCSWLPCLQHKEAPRPWGPSEASGFPGRSASRAGARPGL